jgi:hypothetical protein
MAASNFCKLFLIPVSLFLFFSGSIFAQTAPVTETVNISAKVGEEIVVTPGGGVTGGFAIPKTAVRFSGQAYPDASVTLLKQGSNVISVKANSAGEFNILLEEKYDSKAVYSLFAVDVLGNRSVLVNYPIAVERGFITYLSGIRFAPTIVVDKIEVRIGGYLTVSGYALPGQEIEVYIAGESRKIFTLSSNPDGTYKIVLPLLSLPVGNYQVSVKYPNDSRLSKIVNFAIGTTDIFNADEIENIPGDCNADRIINITDFSILAFWYGKNMPPACVDANKDNKINLTDFSILAFWWTG